MVDEQFTPLSPDCTLNGTWVDVTKAENIADQHVYRTGVMQLNTSAAAKATARSSTSNLVGVTNLVDITKLGTLRISKQIREGANISQDASFDIRVRLGDSLLPVGTTYCVLDTQTQEVISENEKVITAGIVILKAGQTVVIERILSASEIQVVEDGFLYSASYYCADDNVLCTGNGAVGTMPLGGNVEIVITNDDSNVITDKTVAAIAGTTDEFMLTLEAFATGITSSVPLTVPVDIVLVLDQSASMYTPKGATADHYDRWGDPTTIYNTNGIGKVTLDALDAEKGTKLGYYVAQTKTANRQSGNANISDWFIAQYVKGTGWVYVRVGDTTTPVRVDVKTAAEYVSNDVGSQCYTTIHSGNQDENGEYLPIESFYYYESQYAALYESVTGFVKDLAQTGFTPDVESITGEAFLEFVSSNYQNITCTHTVYTVGEAADDNRTADNMKLATSKLVISQSGNVVNIHTAVKSADTYAKSSATGSISIAFDSIMTSVSSASVTLDETTVLKEYLSDYFDLNNVKPEDIQVVVAKVMGKDANGE